MPEAMKRTLLIAVCLLGVTYVYAQPVPPNAPTPFGALEALLASGAALGVRKLYKKAKDRA